jgi:hypothetical protein
MKQVNVNAERIFALEGGMGVYGEDNTLWYVVTANTATTDDFAEMLNIEPRDKPLTITNNNIGTWRKQSRDKSQK